MVETVWRIRSVERGICHIAAVCTVIPRHPGRNLDLSRSRDVIGHTTVWFDT